MKNVYSCGKIIRTSILGLFALVLFASFSACRDKEEDENENVTLQFKVAGAGYDSIKAVVTQIGVNQNTVFSVPGTNWESLKQVVNTSVGSVNITATADGDTATSNLEVSIWINGKEVSKKSSTGLNLNATTSAQLYQQYK